MKTKVSVLTLIISCLLVFIATYSIPFLKKKEAPVNKMPVDIECPDMMDQIRIKKYELIQPLVLANITAESASLNGIRSKVQQYCDQLKSNQKVDEVTVYFRKMNTGEWFCTNPNQTYNPASMSKIIYIITYLKEAESNPGVLRKKIFFSRHFAQINQQNIKTFSLKEGVNYTVNELLNFMVKYSDNDATVLLSQNMNLTIYHQLFIELNIPMPDEFGEYAISAMDYSKFFRVLYNASYIRPDFSEYGLQLLTLSNFTDGIRKGVDSTVVIAHKFGERVLGNRVQMHEFGIVYVNNNPYLIGVLTKGSSLPQLSSIIAEISRIVYSEYVNMFPI